jgi:glycosyltransferase involved in cell wall biosynthesis
MREYALILLKRLRREVIGTLRILRAVRELSRAHYLDALHFVAQVGYLDAAVPHLAAKTMLRIIDARAKTASASIVSLTSNVSTATYRRFSDPNQRQLLHTNMIVLKAYRSAAERGVLLLKYDEVLNAFPLLFDVQRIQERYHIVLEPSFSGYMQPFARLYDPAQSIVLVQTTTDDDRREFSKLGLLTTSICAGDWVDERIFRFSPGTEKVYDFVMISTFTPIKRHEFVFSALKKHWKGDLRFALVGSRFAGSKVERVNSLLAKYGLSRYADVFVDVPQPEVWRVLSKSRCHVLCSLREGANRASFEALLTGIPALVPAGHVGFPAHRFPANVIRHFRTKPDLVDQIQACASVDSSSVHQAVCKQSGSRIATSTVSGILRQACLARGDQWTSDLHPKANRIQVRYCDPADFARFGDDYKYIANCSRDCFAYDDCLAKDLLTSS